MNLDKFHKLDIVLICGLPGSGKSEFAMEHFNKDNRKRINRSEIRKFMFEMTSFGDKWSDNMFNEKQEYLVKYVETRIVEYFIERDQKILVDNTGITKDSRKHYIEGAKRRNKTIGMIFLNAPVKKCIQHVESKGSTINTSVISNLYASIEIPKNAREEGFNEVLVLDNY